MFVPVKQPSWQFEGPKGLDPKGQKLGQFDHRSARKFVAFCFLQATKFCRNRPRINPKIGRTKLMEISAPSTGNNPKVVIIGGGFGGMYAARILANQPVDVTLIDRTNHHLFQPLLYQVATAMLSPADIAQPIRSILRDAKNVRVVMGRVETIDTAAKIVHTHGAEYPYHYLILAAGARHSYFGNDHWEAFAPGLKNLSDALELRRRILNAFEIAETARDPEVQEAAMTFVIIGAGPTGVEMAGSISELAKRTIVHDFRKIQTKKARIILLDAAPKVLPMFDETLCASALKQLEKLDIEVKVGTKVLGVTPEGVQLENELIRARTVIWAAGNAASPLAKQLGETDRQGRIIVSADLSVPGHPEIFAIGESPIFLTRAVNLSPGLPRLRCRRENRRLGTFWLEPSGVRQNRLNIWTKGAWPPSVEIKPSLT